jgi:hypothetical protein
MKYETDPLDVSLLVKGLQKEHNRHHGLGDLNMTNNINKRKQTRDVSHYDLAIYIKMYLKAKEEL